jgi:hypothetical protein
MTTERTTARRVIGILVALAAAGCFWIGLFHDPARTLAIYALIVTAPLVFPRGPR